jgi:carbamoyltransferase
MTYFDFATGLTMTNKKFNELFGGPPRKRESKITQREMDLAASIQKVTENIVIKIAKNVLKETGEKNLCLAGGVALNCVVNGILFREKIFENIWIQPAAGDAGGALGAALAVWHLHYKGKRIENLQGDHMKGAYLGPEFSNTEIEAELKECGAVYKKLSDSELFDKVSNAISEGDAVGWMQGRMEFGPRALGGRSIIADPRSKEMQKNLNLKVKYRESFRPFAPSILCDDISEWFEHDLESPYMLMVANIKNDKRLNMTNEDETMFGINKLNVERSSLPAITHVDYSARIQTVHKETNPRYYALIKSFKKKTGCPVVINTSFNVRGEPIVCSPTDAFKCFMGTELDLLSIGNFLLIKKDQNRINKINYEKKYELD